MLPTWIPSCKPWCYKTVHALFNKWISPGEGPTRSSVKESGGEDHNPNAARWPREVPRTCEFKSPGGYRNSFVFSGSGNGTPTFGDSWQLFTKLNTLLSYNRAIALLRIFPNELNIYVHTNVYSRFITAKSYKQPRCPPSVDEWVNCSNPDNEILLGTKKKRAVKPWRDLREP